MKDLISKIKRRDISVGIIGQGYVGLPLALAFAKNFKVIGYDTNRTMIDSLRSGKSQISDVSDSALIQFLNKSYFPTHDSIDLKTCDFIIICVPTPLNEEREPELSYIKSACQDIAKILRKGQFIILESTTYPGTTKEIVVPLLQETGLRAGKDFGVAYSPERIDPGNRQYAIHQVPKVVGGINDECTDIAAHLYGSIIEKIIRVRDTETAEAVKMVENIFRNVNIALVNELSLIFEKMGINTWEVIESASSKPFGYMPFFPGPGVGGHCIPLDPFYMSYKAKKFGFIPRFIETAGEINEFMKMHAVNLICQGLKKVQKTPYKAKISVIGLSYKKNISDIRESPSIKIIEELKNLGAIIRVYDPYAKTIVTKAGRFDSESSLSEALMGADCAIFVVDHDEFRHQNIKDLAGLMAFPVIVDCKNIYDNEQGIIYLGIGKSTLTDT